MGVEVRNISKQFVRFPALKDVSLKVKQGELLALLGPSGSGKTTLLRIIGGLEFPEPGSGKILLHDQDVTDVPARERQIGFVFQHYALFKHMSVFENIAFGLRLRPRKTRPAEDAITKRVKDLLKLVQLEGLEGRLPAHLSGGQRQRVALARALAVEPKVLLLDEPFGALDAKVRKELRRWIRHLHNEIHLTSIFVTHDQDEALEVSDRVVVMNHGQIEQLGTPDEVYGKPANAFVFSFLGRSVNFKGRIKSNLLLLGSTVTDHEAADGPVHIYVRPQDLELAATPFGGLGLEAVVRDVNHAGPLIYLELQRADDGSTFEMEVPTESVRSGDLRVGKQLHVNLNRFRVFKEGPDGKL